MDMHGHATVYMEVNQQTEKKISSLLAPCSLLGLNSGHQDWWQSPLPTELHCRPKVTH